MPAQTPRRATQRLFFATGTADLCPDCHAVLLKEGTLAGDPGEAPVTMEGWKRTEPAPVGKPCNNCVSLEAYEATHAALDGAVNSY